MYFYETEWVLYILNDGQDDLYVCVMFDCGGLKHKEKVKL